jgi:hypothetical protein
MIIAGCQTGYFQWLGLFEQIHRVDTFVVIDDVQFTIRDWRNRNRIKIPYGISWLTVPVLTKNKRFQNLIGVKVNNNSNWIHKHINSLKINYNKAQYFNLYIDDIVSILNRKHNFLLDLDLEIFYWLVNSMGMKTKIVLSSSLNIRSETAHDKFVEMARILGANTILEAAAGRNWMDIEYFQKNGISIVFQDYNHPTYNQLYMMKGGFISHLSILDLLFNHGPDSLSILSGQRIIPLPDGVSVRHANDIKSVK